MRARSVCVLLSEGSSLTSREHVTVLGGVGVRVEVMQQRPVRGACAPCGPARTALARCPNCGPAARC